MAEIKNPLGLGAILSGGSALLQAIMGGIQASRGVKGFKRAFAQRPEYEIPEEYRGILAQYQQARAANMPGYEQTLGQVGQMGARARGAAERGAISSTAYGSQVGDIYQKELDALQNLGIQQAQYKSSMLDKVTGAQEALAGQKTQQWDINKYIPWQTEMNRYGEMKQAGMQNLFGGIQSGVGNISDLIGTKYYTDVIKGLYGTNTQVAGSPVDMSKYRGGNPQQNLLETTKKLLMGIPVKSLPK